MSLSSAEPTVRTSFPVRPASLRDAKAIAEAHVNAWQESVRQAGPTEALNSLTVERRQAAWREAISQCEPQVLVATDRDKVVGFVAFDRSRDKGTPATTGELWALCVAPAHWGRGVGQALWDAAREGLQEEGCIKATLWVPVRFERVRRFAERVGFQGEPESTRPLDLGGIRIDEVRLSRSVF
ncbi:GNAT family N-acetyltransferase [Piscinibacter sakaiensis]|uniref:GCN5-related N-acetyltransferase n=1 Tax=Piscinibacter sakaiensis TaxID=1547922 RepID=A0A0K8NT36_PISS1|nr:GNAT family N-acetyltransferase [Piscinibacter sakaiensis]GAP33561.1 GCN5-related N-acetyltransferase [Piscinibacter sakaiensis]